MAWVAGDIQTDDSALGIGRALRFVTDDGTTISITDDIDNPDIKVIQLPWTRFASSAPRYEGMLMLMGG